MCIYISISIYVYMYIFKPIYIHLYLSIYIYIYLYLSIYIYIFLYPSISIESFHTEELSFFFILCHHNLFCIQFPGHLLSPSLSLHCDLFSFLVCQSHVHVCVVCQRRNLLKFQVLFALVRHFCICFFSAFRLLFFLIFLHFPLFLCKYSLPIFLFGYSNMLHTFVRQETGTATPPPPPPQVVAHVAYYSHFSDCLSFCLPVCLSHAL